MVSELDDSALEQPTDELIQPLSISSLEEDQHAADQQTAGDANALNNAHVQRRHPSPEPNGLPPANTDEDSLIMALATDLRTFQEFEGYRYRVGSDSDGESVPEDYDADDADED